MCVEYLFAARWPADFACPVAAAARRGRCTPRRGLGNAPAAASRPRSLAAPGSRTTPQLPLTTWFWPAYLMATHSTGSRLATQCQLARKFLQPCAAAVRLKPRPQQAAPGRSALAGLVQVDETEIACRSKHYPVTRGRRTQPSGQDADRRRRRGAGRRRWTRPHSARRRSDYSANSLHPFVTQKSRARATAKTMDGPPIPALPALDRPSPRHRQDGRPYRCCSWVHRIFVTLNRAASISNPTSTSSSSASTAAHPARRLPLLAWHRRRPPFSPTKC